MGKYALLIGVGDYRKGLSALPAAPNDATALEKVLKDPEIGEFDQVKLLINPTHSKMNREIELWFEGRKSEDLILLFFSGHGVKDEWRNLYFAACDTEKERDRLIRSSAISSRFLNDCSRNCKAKYQVIILDCCFSGAYGDAVPRDPGDIHLKEQLGLEGKVVLTSTNAVDYSFEEKGQNLSIYTRFLVEGIATGAADEDGDGIITTEELHRYAASKVQKTSPAMSPRIFIPQGEGYRIKLARSPQDDPKLKYRKEAEKRADASEFSIAAKTLLMDFRQKFAISDKEAEVIEEEVLKPFREYEQKRKKYQDTLRKCLREESSLKPRTIRDLQDLREHLQLKLQDSIAIEQQELKGFDLEKYATKPKQHRQVTSNRQEKKDAKKQRQANIPKPHNEDSSDLNVGKSKTYPENISGRQQANNRGKPGLSSAPKNKYPQRKRENNSILEQRSHDNSGKGISSSSNRNHSFVFFRKTIIFQCLVIVIWLIADHLMLKTRDAYFSEKVAVVGLVAGVISGFTEGLALRVFNSTTKREEILFKYPLLGLCIGGIGWSIVGQIQSFRNDLGNSSNEYWIGLFSGMLIVLSTAFYASRINRQSK